MSKQITISRICNNKVRVLYYFYLTLFFRKSRLYFGGKRAIPTACGGRSTIGAVVAFRLVHSVVYAFWFFFSILNTCITCSFASPVHGELKYRVTRRNATTTPMVERPPHAVGIARLPPNYDRDLRQNKVK